MRGSPQGDPREHNGHWSPSHVITTSGLYTASTSSAQLRMQPGLLGKMTGPRTSLGFLSG